MKTFYFTYGLNDQPYPGGWTEVVAPDMESALSLFRAFHPSMDNDLLNCAGIYSQEEFVVTSMFLNGNFGKRCWERIFVHRVFERQ